MILSSHPRSNSPLKGLVKYLNSISRYLIPSIHHPVTESNASPVSSNVLWFWIRGLRGKGSWDEFHVDPQLPWTSQSHSPEPFGVSRGTIPSHRLFSQVLCLWSSIIRVASRCTFKHTLFFEERGPNLNTVF